MARDDDDLTKIEDLGEFKHDLDASNPFTNESTLENASPPPLPEQEIETPDDPFKNNLFETPLQEFKYEENSEIINEPSELIDNPIVELNNDANEINDSEIGSDDIQTFDTINPIAETANIVPPKEDFKELKDFIEVKSESSNPPYAILLEGDLLKYSPRIIMVLKEFNIINDQTENQYKIAIDQGKMLVSQLSELNAILIASKLRDLDIEIKVDLNETLIANPDNDRGLTLLDDNKNENFINIPATYQEIFVTRSVILPEINIQKHIGLLSIELIIPETEFMQTESIDLKNSTPSVSHAIDLIKMKAFENKANAIIDLQLQFIKLTKDFKILVTGNAVQAIY